MVLLVKTVAIINMAANILGDLLSWILDIKQYYYYEPLLSDVSRPNREGW